MTLLYKLPKAAVDGFVTVRPRTQGSYSSNAVKTAELRLAAHIVVHGSFLTEDNLTPALDHCFQDSRVASRIALGRPMCAAVVTKVLRPTFKDILLRDMRDSPYCLIVDDRTDV
ncbi:hypothetical protein HPB48_010870 [Haemaphysalis longicornis]|uniref:Uncharacterized protein n=1 Tax=Haemaphysalis longicornis TaxID=44386 RepID=A0A9J6GGX7_HAELO|nr:hypothetical protein HPB48_010870 [Haemaphysalis longicornis]